YVILNRPQWSDHRASVRGDEGGRESSDAGQPRAWPAHLARVEEHQRTARAAGVGQSACQYLEGGQVLVLKQQDRLQRLIASMADEVQQAAAVRRIEQIEGVEGSGNVQSRKAATHGITLVRGQGQRVRGRVVGRQDQAVGKGQALAGGKHLILVPAADRAADAKRLHGL